MRPEERPRVLFAAAVAVLIVAAGFGLAYAYPSLLPHSRLKSNPFLQIQHVIVVMMENHAYDNLFGRYCLSSSAVCPQVANGLPPDTCMPIDPARPALGCVPPYNLNELSNPDMPHSWNASHTAFANGTMNGFYLAEDTRQTMGTFNGSLIPTYWAMAQQFGLGDSFFSSTLSYSTPNHWYLISGTAPTIALTSFLNTVHDSHLYLNQSNRTDTVEQELVKNESVSWKWYDWPLATYQSAISMIGGSHQEPGNAYSYWNVLAAKNQSYVPAVVSHFVNRSAFFTDVAQGSLPQVSWFIPGFNDSDHNPANLSSGQDLVASIVNSVEQSVYWGSTAILISWDDYGGYFDHVAPAVLDSEGNGFRTPLLVISPWTAAGLVVHAPLQFESILHFIEWRWGLGCLTARDCGASLPTEFFNFGLHRAPVFFPEYAQAEYPYVARTGVYTGAANWSGPDPSNSSLSAVD